MNISRLPLHYLLISLIWVFSVNCFASTEVTEDITELKSHEITHINLKFDDLLPKDKSAFTSIQWEALVREPITISLKQESEEPFEVNAQFYKEKFLKQFKNLSCDEDRILEISFPYKIMLPHSQKPDYMVLRKIDYVLSTNIGDAPQEEITKRYIEGDNNNYKLSYPCGKEKIVNPPYFLTAAALEGINDSVLSENFRKIRENGIDVDQRVYKFLYDECSYYEVFADPDMRSNLKEICFENHPQLQNRLKITKTKNENRFHLATILTEKFEVDNEEPCHAHLMLKTPLELVTGVESINQIVGSLPEKQQSYDYLELSYRQLPNNKTGENASLHYIEDPRIIIRERESRQSIPTVVKLELGVNSKEKWKEYLTTSPIKNRKKYTTEPLKRQVNESSYVTLMGDALKQNSMIRTVEVYTDSLTPSLYNTLKEWKTQSREVFIFPLKSSIYENCYFVDSGEYSIFNYSPNTFFVDNDKFLILDAKGNKINFYDYLYYDNRTGIDLFRKLRVSQTDQLKTLETKHNLLKDLKEYQDSLVSSELATIYSLVAKHCFNNKKIIKDSSLESIYDVYEEWLEEAKIKATVTIPKAIDYITIDNEYILQAIFFANLACRNFFFSHINHYQDYLKHKLLREDYFKHKSLIKFRWCDFIDVGTKLKVASREAATSPLNLVPLIGLISTPISFYRGWNKASEELLLSEILLEISMKESLEKLNF